MMESHAFPYSQIHECTVTQSFTEFMDNLLWSINLLEIIYLFQLHFSNFLKFNAIQNSILILSFYFLKFVQFISFCFIFLTLMISYFRCGNIFAEQLFVFSVRIRIIFIDLSSQFYFIFLLTKVSDKK